MQRLIRGPKTSYPYVYRPRAYSDEQMTEEKEEVTAMTQKEPDLVKISVFQCRAY
jgi:hypothetical protein